MKRHGKVTPELRRWITSQIEAGRSPVELLNSMTAQGWPEGAALEIIERTLKTRLAQLKARATPDPARAAQVELPPSVAVPQPLVGESPTSVTIDTHSISVLARFDKPRVMLFGNFLSAAECDSLIAATRGRLTPSQVIDTQTGGNRDHDGRTSEGMCFQRGESPLIERIERRIETLLGWPYENGEGLQILHYHIGQEYRPHFDYMDPSQSGAAPFLARGGQRVGTFIIYLNTPDAGGATSFPHASLEIAAQRGQALFFSYDRPHASTGSFHGGMPVLAGEKWIATKWLRESPHV